MQSQPCFCCSHHGPKELVPVKELQLGLGESFTYQLCPRCNSLQLLDPPADLAPYYPNEDYYSFQNDESAPAAPGFFRKIKTAHLLYGQHSILGPLVTLGYRIPEYYHWVKHTDTRLDHSILDVGSGSGDLLRKLYRMGFQNLTGIDPFITSARNIGSIRILKKDIFGVQESFDLVMMHHALEHMTDPLAALQKAYNILPPGRFLLVRIPVMGNYGWNTYREFWSGIDAPRHIFIPSEKGMVQLAERAGFKLTRLEYDSTDYMIWSSEQYKAGISLYDKRSYMVNRKDGYYSKKEVKKFREKMAEENSKNNADTAAFYLQKPVA